MSQGGTASAIGDRYNDNTYLAANADWHAADSPWKAQLILDMLRRHRVEPGTLAEVGCGSGEILVNLARSLPETQFAGFDLSNDAYAICKPKEHDRLHFKLEDVAVSGEHFDVLTIIDVFEHVEDYFGFLRSIKPVADWHVFHIPLEVHASALLRGGFLKARAQVGHLHFFTAETALAALKDTGYEIVGHEFTSAFDPGSGARKPLRTRLAWLPRRLLWSLSPNLLSKSLGGCSLLVLARPMDRH